MSAPLRHRYVGERVQRVEDARLLTGAGRFVDDVELDGMLEVAFLRSPHAHARIISVDIARAMEMPGVQRVFVAADAPEPLVTSHASPTIRTVRRPLLAHDRVRFVGEPVAAVVARSRYEAEDAVEMLEVEWEPLDALTDPELALEPGAPVLHPELGDNVAAEARFASPDLEAAFDRAERVFRKRFRAGRAAAMPMECRGVVASWERTPEALIVWSSTQIPHGLRAVLAQFTGLTESAIRVIASDVGGGFGGKGHLATEELLVPLLARLVGRPLKWIEDRYEHMAANAHAKEMSIDFEIAVGEDGRFLAFRTRMVGDCGAYSVFPYSGIADAISAATLVPSLYAVDAAGYHAIAAMTTKCPAGAYRAVGRSSGQAAQELLIDEVARELGIDAVELRVRNTIPDTEPYVSKTGMRYDGGSFRQALLDAAAAVGYDDLRARQRELREQGRHLGIGVSPYVEPTGQGTAMSAAIGVPGKFFDEAHVVVQADGSAVVRTGQQSHGQGHETTFAQLAADALGLDIEHVTVVEGDTATAAQGMGTFASRGAVVGGGTVRLAAEEVGAKLRALAGHALEIDPRDLELTEGHAMVRGSPHVRISIPELARRAYFDPESRPDGMEPGLSAARFYDPPETYGNGAVIAVVEVDVETGIVDLQQVVAVEDCGTIINPMVVDGQVAGGVAQGIGLALYEEMVYAEDGQLLTTTLMDYPMPSTGEVPDPLIRHLATPSPVTVGGIKGAGEAGTQAAPAAVAQAVADALAPLGVSVDRIPLAPDTVFAMLRSAASRA